MNNVYSIYVILNRCVNVLQAACLAPQGLLGDPGSFYFTPIANDDITWNFEKFLVDQAGKPVRRWAAILVMQLDTCS